eukprot:scaffold10693_cov70-Phaeocystis_antarctica.AAC.5
MSPRDMYCSLKTSSTQSSATSSARTCRSSTGCLLQSWKASATGRCTEICRALLLGGRCASGTRSTSVCSPLDSDGGGGGEGGLLSRAGEAERVSGVSAKSISTKSPGFSCSSSSSAMLSSSSSSSTSRPWIHSDALFASGLGVAPSMVRRKYGRGGIDGGAKRLNGVRII